MLKQVSDVCADINFYAVSIYQKVESLSAGILQKGEMTPYMDVTDALYFQNQNILLGSCKKFK